MDPVETPFGRITQSEVMLWTKMANPETVNVERLFGDGQTSQPPTTDAGHGDMGHGDMGHGDMGHGDTNPAVEEDSLRHGRYDGQRSYEADRRTDVGRRTDVRRRSDVGRRTDVDRRTDVSRRTDVVGRRGGHSNVRSAVRPLNARSAVRSSVARSSIPRSDDAPSDRRDKDRDRERDSDRDRDGERDRERDRDRDRDRERYRERDEGRSEARGEGRGRDRDEDRDYDHERSMDSRNNPARYGRDADRRHDGPPSSSVVKRPRSREKSESGVPKRARGSDDDLKARPTAEPPNKADDASSQFSAKRRHEEGQKRDLLDQLDELRVMHGLGKVRDGRHREYGMGDDIRSIRFQVERLLRLKDQKENCEFMHDGIKLGCYVIETAVNKLGWDALDGWADTVDGQKKRLRPILAKLYHRWFKRGGFSNPYLELALALGGSAFMVATSKGQKAQVPPVPTHGPAPQHRDANNADGREFSFDDFETHGPSHGPGQGQGHGHGPGQGQGQDDDDDDDMPGPQDAGGGPFSALAGGGGGGPSGIMGMVGSLMGMKS